MKKVVVLALALAMVAGPALASTSIRNTKHDLSSSSAAAKKSTNTGELCVFCHTPHNGAAAGAPLWNRSAGVAITFAAGDLYNSATLDQTNSGPTDVLAAVNASDAKLCLSCHDGASLDTGLVNPSNAAAAQPAGLTDITNGAVLQANLGTTLTNDHPIGMDYGSVQTADTLGFNAPTPAAGSVPEYVTNANVILYTTNGVMWCSSCHDVHNNTNAPFLVTTNAGSALCLDCHKK